MKNHFRLALILFLAAGVIGGGVLILKNLSHGSHGQHGDLYYCPMHPTYTSDRPGNCPICNMKLVKREPLTPTLSPEGRGKGEGAHAAHKGMSSGGVAPLKEFSIKEILAMKPKEICLLHKCKHGQCEMVITEEIARLGKCPHCGEDLGIIVKDLMPKGYGNVQLSGEKQQLIGIKTSEVTKQTFHKTIRTVGRIAYDPSLYQAEEEYVQAVQALKKAQSGSIPEIVEQASKLVDSSKIKLKLLGLSEDLITEIETAGKADRSLLYSDAGSSAWLYASIYEYEMPLVKTGQEIEVEIPAVPGKKFTGIIRSVDSVLDPMTRSVRVRAVLDNAEGQLKPEMYVNASLRVNLGDVLAVPEDAVFSTGEENIIFVAKADGVFEPRHVELGAKSEGMQEVKSGLSAGEEVVTSGNFLIDSESRLKAVLEGMDSGGGGHQHGA